MSKKKRKTVGYMPFCVKNNEGTQHSLGLWSRWFTPERKILSRELKAMAQGFKFKIVPVFVDN